jgi:anti-anti-sigma factor
MTEHAGPTLCARERDSSPSARERHAGVVLGATAGMPVVSLAGPVDRELGERAQRLIQLVTSERDGPITIDVSGVDDVNGALLGLLLRTSRRLAWRNRQLIIACRDPETSRRLRIAGLDELATLTECR